MTNGELIDILSKHPNDAEIVYEFEAWDVADSVDVEVIPIYAPGKMGWTCSLELRLKEVM